MANRSDTAPLLEGTSNGQPRDDDQGAAAGPPDLLAAAIAYIGLLWSVIRLCNPAHQGGHPPKHAASCERPGKHPAWKWKPFMTRRAPEAEVRQWWGRNPALNVGVVTGLVSRIVMVDIDTPQGAAEWERLCDGKVPDTWEFGTGRGGKHLVFGWPYDETPKGNPFKEWKGHLDFLGEEQQSVLPPSLHKNGLRYRWTKGGPDSGMPLAPVPEWLRDRVLKAGKKSRGRGGVGTAAAGPTPPAPAPVPDRLKRAIGYAHGFQPAIQGEGGRTVAFNLFRKLILGFGLSDDEAVTVAVWEWNGRCVPPWTNEELMERAGSARKDGSAKRMEDRPKPSKRRHHSTDGTGGASPQVSVDGVNGTQADATERNHVNADAAICNHPQPSHATPSDTPRTPDAPAPAKLYGRLASALKPRKRQFFIRPWFPARALSFLIGAGNSGKSTMLAWILAQAERPVLFPGFEEDPEGDLRERLEIAGVHLPNLLIVDNEPLFLFSDAHKLATILRQHKADFVAFDPLDSYIHQEGRENDNPTVRTALEELCRVTHDANATAIGIRHPGKASGNLVRGAGSWRNVPRVILEAQWDKGRSDKRTLKVDKYPWSPWPSAQHFHITGPERRPGKFELIGNADESMLQLGEEVPDRMGQTKHMEARRFLRSELAEGPLPANEIFSRGKAHAT